MLFLDSLREKYKINLNEQQQQAVKHVTGPALVLAGPGSGKTTVITARTAYLIFEEKVDPECILTLTFNKAAQLEMKHRFDRIYGEDVGCKVNFSTIHSFCNGVVTHYEKRQGRRLKRIEGDETVGENKRKIIRDLYQKINEAKINDEDLENLINEIGLVKNKMIKNIEETDFTTRNFPAIYKAYDEYKKSNLYIDFDDMLTYAYTILVKFKDILGYYQSKYSFIQVDEGQDLSKIQFEIIKLLTNKKDSNIFIVADDDQSIYGFRGAEPHYILNIGEQFGKCSLYQLEYNYRSSRNIVVITSGFIKSNVQRFDKNHKTNNREKCDPVIVEVPDECAQMEYIIQHIDMHIKQGEKVAVLYRNNLSSIVIADAFERRGIPFKIKQNKLFFFSQWVVQDIFAFLKFALNQCDGEAFSKIYYKMNRYISKNMLEAGLNSDCEESIIDGILACDGLMPYQKKTLQELKREFKRLMKMHPLLALDYIESKFNYFDTVEEYCENTGISFDYLYRLFGILKIIGKECLTLPIFLERLEELQELFEKPREIDYKKAVTMTTIHSSKGLEYDVVFMVDLGEDEIPGTKVVEQAQKNQDTSILEEERRIFYVGMTRAREYLYLINPATRNGIRAPRSTFVNEVISAVNKRMANELREGMVLNHKHFGQGVIVAVLEQKGESVLLEVDFRGVRRKLDLIICVKNGLISFSQ